MGFDKIKINLVFNLLIKSAVEGYITEEEFVTGSGESVESKLVVKCVQGAWRTVTSWQLFMVRVMRITVTSSEEQNRETWNIKL